METTTKETKRAYRRRGAKRDTSKLDRFVEELSRPGVTQAEAAVAAGYSDKPESAKVRGSQLMRDPNVRARVEALRAGRPDPGRGTPPTDKPGEPGRKKEESPVERGSLFLVHAPGPGLYRLCFAPGDSVPAAFELLAAASPVPLRLLWSLPGRRAALARALAPLSGRLHHGVWYRLSVDDADRLAAAVETSSASPGGKV